MKGISIYRASFILIFGIALVAALYFGRKFFIPFCFGTLLAMLFLPVSKKLESWGVNRIPAIFICLFLILLLLAGVAAVLAFQSASFAKDLPQIQQKLSEMITSLQQWVQTQFGVAPQKQIEMLKKGVSSLSQSGSNFLTTFFSGLLGSLTSFALILVYIFFLLWKREKYEEFFLKLTRNENTPEAKETLSQITKVSSEYLAGRLLSMLVLAIFYGIGFSVVGLKNGVLLAIIAVIPTIIPYVGPVIGGFFPLAMAFVGGSSGLVLPVLIVLVVAQLIDNYLIEPFVLGSNLSLSPFITIISIVVGELIWGVAGMILFIPLFAIIHIVADHVPALHPVAFLLGDTEGKPEWMQKVKEWFGKAKDQVNHKMS
jgi:predicted PurR-regulated permease PerM